MSFVLLSVICSVLVSVLLKLTRAWRIDVGQAIAWNYLVAGALTIALLRPQLGSLEASGTPWLALLALGVLLPTIFLALAAAVRHAGIVRSDAAQRLSLVLSLLAAFLLFGEQLTFAKTAGMAVGLVALLCGPSQETQFATIEGLIRAAEDGSLPLKRIEDALARQRRVKERFLAAPQPKPLSGAALRAALGRDESQAIADEMGRFA